MFRHFCRKRIFKILILLGIMGGLVFPIKISAAEAMKCCKTKCEMGALAGTCSPCLSGKPTPSKASACCKKSGMGSQYAKNLLISSISLTQQLKNYDSSTFVGFLNSFSESSLGPDPDSNRFIQFGLTQPSYKPLPIIQIKSSFLI